jgi:predicted TIM-barrel fold metal-dependent hydrolase
MTVTGHGDVRTDSDLTVVHADAIPFVDAHHHLWDLGRHRYAWLEGDGLPATTAWLGDYQALRRTHLLPDFLDAAAGTGLVASVHVEAGWSDGDPVGETHWLDAASRRPFPAAIVARVDLRAADAERSLDAHAASPRFRGVRMSEMHGLVEDAAFRRGIRALADRGLSYDMNTRVPWMAQGAELAALVPLIPVMVDNMANPTSSDRDYLRAWETGISELAAVENVVMKVSGLGMFDHGRTRSSVTPLIRHIVDAFGPSRVMFGSNWPVDGLYGTYPDLVASYRELVSEYTAQEQHLLLHGTAEHWYRILVVPVVGS